MAKKKIKIVTDSVSDLPKDLIEKWNIDIIPCYVNFNGESYADDGVELDRRFFYDSLPLMETFPSTAAPPPALAEEILQRALEGYDHLISIHVPEKLSATVNNVRIAAQNLPSDRVTVLDSGTLSMGLGYQALIAAQVAEETGDVEQVLAAIEKVRNHVKVYAAFATMEYLRRSGRVSGVVAAVGSLLQIRPIVDVHDGEVESAYRVRTFKKAVAKLEELVRVQAPLEHLVILQINNGTGALEFQERISDIAPEDTIIIEVGPTLGAHIGPGALGAVTLTQRWRES